MAGSQVARTNAETVLSASSEDFRVRALERLYLRREAVNDLIRSLEIYAQAGPTRRSPCISITAGRKWSS
jgi:hypothetical protein